MGSTTGLLDRPVECGQVVAAEARARSARTQNSAPLEEALDLVPMLAIPLERMFYHHGSGASCGTVEDKDGSKALLVETAPEQWSYSLACALTDFDLGEPDCWLSIELCVEYGRVYVGVLNHTRTDFLVQADCSGPTKDFVEVSVFVRDTYRVSELIFRNANEGGVPARFRVRSVRVMREPDEMPDHRLARNEATIGAEPHHLAGPAFAQATGAIVRTLGSENGSQTIIILPTTPKNLTATIDLPEPLRRKERLVLSLHVIEGEAAIGAFCHSTGRSVSEHRERAGSPFTSLELEIGDTGANSLLFRNLSSTGTTRVLLHGVGEASGPPIRGLADRA
jgi:hypothetical protein